jgi:ornithine carbamoyltransferase
VPAHFLSIASTPTPVLVSMLRRAVALRATRASLLSGLTLACLFEKSSLRTRVSFEQAMRRLGGTAMTLMPFEIGIGQRESPEDIARVLAGMVDAVMARVASHETLERMASVSSVPVINGLSDLAHPAQALADILTLTDEFSPADPSGLKGRTVTFVGDGNNVARSLAVACGKLGVKFIMSGPDGYALGGEWLVSARARVPGLELVVEPDPRKAVARTDAIYCDTFVSMGQESERSRRLAAFEGYQVNDRLLAAAPAHAIVMHCLPAHRGEEITDEVIDGARSRVFQQAHNRLHGQMGLLAELLKPDHTPEPVGAAIDGDRVG